MSNENFLEIDFTSCIRKLPHPVTGQLTLVTEMTSEEIQQAEENVSFDREVADLIEGNIIKVHTLIPETSSQIYEEHLA